MRNSAKEITTAPYETMRVVWFWSSRTGIMQYRVIRNRRVEWKTVRHFDDYGQMYSVYHNEVAKNERMVKYHA